ncbi:hypothetical protein M3Y94_00713800 [Aphelenchoides besseyi]|nr:hypothetical protein M3Y94_00713800 [Aphelenchoides besseyi]
MIGSLDRTIVSLVFSRKMSVARFLCVAVILLVHVDVVLGAVEAKYKISGVVKCNGMPYADASIVFMENDFLRNDECAAVKTNSSGHFYASQFESDGFFVFRMFSGQFAYLRDAQVQYE